MVAAVHRLLRSLRRRIGRIRDSVTMTRLYRGSEVPRLAQKVVFWVPGGMPGMLQVEGAIAAALKLRGVEVHAVLCDGPFVGCVLRELPDAGPIARWHEACKGCRAATSDVLDLIGIPYSFIGDFVTLEERSHLRDQASSVTWDTLDELDVAPNVRSSIIRFLKGAPLVDQGGLLTEYVYSALVSASAAETAIRRLAPTHVFMSHGVYVDWGPALSASLRHHLPVSAWRASYLDSHFYLRQIRDQKHVYDQLGKAGWDEQRAVQLAPSQEETLRKYSLNRYQEKITFDLRKLGSYTGDTNALRSLYVTMPDKPTWAVMAHINWDAVFDGAPMAYEVFDDWIIDTVERISAITDVNWLFKIHPAEAWTNPDTGVETLIRARFPNLPPHVRLIPATERVNPLDLYNLVDGAVTIYGTAGIELAVMGKPVIVAGEAHYGRRGFTHDALTKESYRELLARVGELQPITLEQVVLAKKYAYTYFIRQQIPLPAVKDPTGWWKFQPQESKALLAGNNPFVDFICERILDGRDFVMTDELVASALSASPLGS